MTNEAKLKRALMLELKKQIRHPRPVIFRHEDRYTHGMPDISLTLRNGTSWWEAKHAIGYLDRGKKIQEQMMRDLSANGGRAFYIIWRTGTDGSERTYVVHPNDLNEWTEKYLVMFVGFDFESLATFMKEVHSDGYVKRLLPGCAREQDASGCSEARSSQAGSR